MPSAISFTLYFLLGASLWESACATFWTLAPRVSRVSSVQLYILFLLTLERGMRGYVITEFIIMLLTSEGILIENAFKLISYS